MKKLSYIIFILALIPIVGATDVLVQPNPLSYVSNMTITQQLNVTVSSNFSGVLFFNINIPFISATITPNVLTYSNGTNTFYPTFVINLPNIITAKNYTGEIDYIYDIIKAGKVDVYLTIPEQRDFNVSVVSRLNVKCGDSGELMMNVTNYGNTDLSLNFTKNASFIDFSSPSMYIYRQGSERTVIFYSIPKDTTPGKYIESIFVDNRTYEIEVNVKDEIPPSLFVVPIEDIKVNKGFELYISAVDNVKIDTSKLYVDLVCEDVPAQTYAFLRYFDNNYSVSIPGITKPTDCVANVYAFDTEGNQNLTQVYFAVDYLYGVDFNEMIVIPRFKTDFFKKTKVAQSNDTINATIKLTRLITPNLTANTTNETLYFTIGVDNGDELTRFGGVGEEVLLTGKVFYLNFKSNALGEFSGTIYVTFPEYVMSDNVKEIRFEGVVGEYTVSDPYENDLYGVRLKCEPHDLGTFDDSYQFCELTLPIDLVPSDAALPVSLKQIGLTDENYELRLANELAPLEKNIGTLQSWLAASWVLFIVMILVVYVYFKPNIFYLNGLYD
jgi:hypothetical protein